MDKSSAQNTRAGFGDRFIAFANKVSDVSGLVAAYLLVPLVVVFLIEIVWPTKIVMSISLIILTLQGLAEIIQLVQRLRAAKREGEQ